MLQDFGVDGRSAAASEKRAEDVVLRLDGLVASDRDSVHLDAPFGGELCGFQRFALAGVVVAVGQQDHDLALDLVIVLPIRRLLLEGFLGGLEPGGGQGEAVSDGGALFGTAIALDQFYRFEKTRHGSMSEGQRTDGVGVFGE